MRVALFLCLCSCAADLSAGADWPQFRGPNADGVSPERGLARSWPTPGPAVLWTRDLARGYAGAAVHNGEVFILDTPNPTQDVLFCLNLATGRESWRYTYTATAIRSFPGARTVPSVDATNVFIMAANGLLQCVNRHTHQPVWQHNIIREYERAPVGGSPRDAPRWGVTQHPLLYRDTVIVGPHSPEAGLIAYQRETGKEVWRSPSIGYHCFSHVTPTLCRLLDTDQVVMLANEHCGSKPSALVTGMDAQTGKRLWSYLTPTRYNIPIPSPLVTGRDSLFITGGYTIGSFGLTLVPDADKLMVKVAFTGNTNCTAHIQTPVLYDGHIYANSFDKFHNKENNGLVCVDLAGKLKWRTGPGVTFDSGNLLIADGMIFLLHGATGELLLIRATPERYEPLARTKVLAATGGEAWAPMALSEGKLLVRDLTQMKCLDVRRH